MDQKPFEVEITFRQTLRYAVQASNRKVAEQQAMQRWKVGDEAFVVGSDCCEVLEVRTNPVPDSDRCVKDAHDAYRYLPTVGELGFPGLDFEGLVGIIAARSSDLPAAARDRIGADIKTASKEPVLAERLASTAQLNIPGDAAEFAKSIDEQVQQLAASAKLLGMKPKQ